MKRLAKSFYYAIRGLYCTVKNERNMRIHVAFTFYVICLGLITGIQKYEWLAVLICIAMVLGAESINTSIESLCDRVQDGFSDKIKIAKDTAAGGVLVCAVISAVVGGMIFFTRERISALCDFAGRHKAVTLLLILMIPAWIFFISRAAGKKNGEKNER